MNLRLRFALFIVIAALAVLPRAAVADQWDPMSRPVPFGVARVNLIDANLTVTPYSRIGIVRAGANGSGGGVFTHCKTFNEPPCVPDLMNTGAFSFYASLVLPQCAAGSFDFCVQDVRIYKEGSISTEAEFKGTSQELTVDAKREFGLPYGGSTLLYTAPGVPHAGGTSTYAIRAQLDLTLGKGQQAFEFNGFSMTAIPYTERQVISTKPRLVPVNESIPVPEDFAPATRKWLGNEWNIEGSSKYVWSGENVAGIAEDFSPNTRVAITVRIPAAAGGWFSGRLKDPIMKLTPISSTINQLTIDASSVAVPRLSADVPEGQFTPQMKVLGMGPGGGSNIESGFDTGILWVEELRPFVNDKSVATTNVWVARRSPVPNRTCFKNDSISGLVTTNATTYSWNPPVYKDGFLDYKVAGLHLMPDGSVTQGTYDLILSSEVARCIYGFSKAPISATISIIGDGGESRSVATTVVSEKDGWLKLAAYGFTFSSPTVRVQLTQPEVTPAAPTVTPKKTVKKTIICVKGKVAKSVTAANPKCPSGFRKR